MDLRVGQWRVSLVGGLANGVLVRRGIGQVGVSQLQLEQDVVADGANDTPEAT